MNSACWILYTEFRVRQATKKEKRSPSCARDDFTRPKESMQACLLAAILSLSVLNRPRETDAGQNTSTAKSPSEPLRVRTLDVLHLEGVDGKNARPRGVLGRVARLGHLLILAQGHGLLVIQLPVAVVLLAGQEFAGYESAYSHSAVNYSSLGYGDLVMSMRWRLLGALEAVDGIVMFGISTARILALVMRLIQRTGPRPRRAPREGGRSHRRRRLAGACVRFPPE